jgi:hypothetical protein
LGYDSDMTENRIDLDSPSTGQLERKLAAGWWLVPTHIRLDGQSLAWQVFHEGKRPRIVESGPMILEHFLGLSDASEEDIVRYARRWGLLMICKHGLLARECDRSGLFRKRFTAVPSENSGCYPQGWPNNCREPIDAWRAYSRLMRDVLNVAARLHENKVTRPEEWPDALRGNLPPRVKEVSVDVGRSAMSAIINEWIRAARVRPSLRWEDPRPRVTLAEGGLFGSLVLQLMLAISRIDGLAVCSACGRGYSPWRMPSARTRHYCETCRQQKVPQREASRAYRIRQCEQKGPPSPGSGRRQVLRRPKPSRSH